MTDTEQAREQVERVARAICVSEGYGPDIPTSVENAMWVEFIPFATAAITAMQPAIDAAVLAERERCAEIAYNFYHDEEHYKYLEASGDIAIAIRKVPS